MSVKSIPILLKWAHTHTRTSHFSINKKETQKTYTSAVFSFVFVVVIIAFVVCVSFPSLWIFRSFTFYWKMCTRKTYKRPRARLWLPSNVNVLHCLCLRHSLISWFILMLFNCRHIVQWLKWLLSLYLSRINLICEGKRGLNYSLSTRNTLMPKEPV